MTEPKTVRSDADPSVVYEPLPDAATFSEWEKQIWEYVGRFQGMLLREDDLKRIALRTWEAGLQTNKHLTVIIQLTQIISKPFLARGSWKQNILYKGLT